MTHQAPKNEFTSTSALTSPWTSKMEHPSTNARVVVELGMGVGSELATPNFLINSRRCSIVCGSILSEVLYSEDWDVKLIMLLDL